MIVIPSALDCLLSFRFRSRASLELELVALRHQLIVLRRQCSRRLRFLSADRRFWVWFYRVWPQILETLIFVKPARATVVKWHRKGFRIYWRWRSRCPGGPKTSDEVRDLIRRMSLANPLRGAPRIHDELLKVGIEVRGNRGICLGAPNHPPRLDAPFCGTMWQPSRRSTCL
jgi:putative transposase